MFSTTEFGAASSQTAATESGNGSPQNRLSRSDGNAPGLSARRRLMKTAVEGTENQTVSSISLMKLLGFINAFLGGQQSHAPRPHATNMSNTDRSNVMSNIWDTRSSSVIW